MTTRIEVQWASPEAKEETIRRWRNQDLSAAIQHVRDQGRTWSCLWELSQLSKLDRQTVREAIDGLVATGFYIFRDGAWVHWPDQSADGLKRFLDFRSARAKAT